MPLRKPKPTSPGRRFATYPDFAELTRDEPEKSLAKEGDHVTLRLPSGEMRIVRAECRATVGVIGNADHQNVKIGKAGRKRHMGSRPQTRGTAMNPVDHPHGGGEGSTTPGRHPVTPWGVPTLGYPTRKKNKQSDRFIVRRRRRKGGKR